MSSHVRHINSLSRMHSLVTIEDDGDFLKGDVASFRVCEIDNDEIEGDDDVDDNVVAPFEVLEGDGVCIVEAGEEIGQRLLLLLLYTYSDREGNLPCDSGLNEQVLGADELRTNVIRHGLHGIASQDTVPR